MKKLLPALLGLSLALSAAGVLAATTSDVFNVKVNFTGTCQADNTTTPAVDFGTYTAFGSPSVVAPTAGVSFKCSRGLAPSAVVISSSNAATATGAVAGLAYSVTVGAGVKSAGTISTAQDYDKFTYTVTGTMASGQAGAGGTTPTAASVNETLVITF
ncbi:MAG: hypothetical protein ACJ8GO_02255 [Ramlibacter sp.]